jgi:hypothetical protein
MLNDDPELLEHEIVDFVAFGKFVHAGMERPRRDIDEPRLLTLIEYTSRFLNNKKSQAGYDEYLRIDFNAVFDSCANNAAIG